MLLRDGRINGRRWIVSPVVLALLLLAGPVFAEYDRSLYMSPDEVKPGMKGYGRTVMAGTNIQTFNVEVISVMHNAFYAQQAVILVRCSGLNLEYSGIIGGMSGSPCYIRDEQGHERMIGAVAYGWTFNKDPVCGVQPITQMLDVAKVRKPKPESQPAGASKPGEAASRTGQSGGIPLEELIALAAGEPVPEGCRLSAIGRPEPRLAAAREEEPLSLQGLRPIEIPLTISCTSKEPLAFLDKRLRRYGLVPIAGGQPGTPTTQPDSVRLEPGSALCVALMTGDMSIEGVGTCTAVIGDQVLGFGHELFGQGTIELPLATGFIHTVIPSVARSEKVGGAVKVVGTLWGDESTAISGVVGRTPFMIPLEVVVNDMRGKRTYRYEIAHDESLSGSLMATGMLESAFNHSAPPRDHTVRHAVEVDFGELGIYRTGNLTSQRQFSEPVVDLMYSVQTLLNAPLAEKAKVRKARAEITVEDTARMASIEEVDLPRTVYKPGETITARVKWVHYRREPMYTSAPYSLTLPADIPDGEYELSLCSVTGQLSALRSEKPHLFQAETLSEALTALNLLGSFTGDRLYMRLNLKRGGMAYKRLEMPDLPGSRRKILSDARLTTEVAPYSEALVVEHPTDFVVNGRYTTQIQVKRHPDQ